MFENTLERWRELWVHLGAPGSTGDKSGSASDRPGSVKDKSGSVDVKPGSADDKPGSTWERQQQASEPHKSQ